MDIRRAIPWLMVAALLSAPVTAQERTPELLPGRLGPWERVEIRQVEPVGVEGRVLKEYGSQRAIAARYESGGRHWEVTVHQMTDRVTAYGAYTFFRDRSRMLDLGQGASLADDRIIFYQGGYFGSAPAGTATEVLALVTEHLEGLPGRRMLLPALPEYLPRSGLINGSDRYLLGPEALGRFLPLAGGDWAGFAYGGEAVFAEYRTPKGKVPFLALDYPTPQITLDRIAEMKTLFNVNGEGDPQRPEIHLMREGTLLYLIPGAAADARTAKAILEDNRYSRELAWTEPPEAFTDEEWLQTVGDLFIGTGLMMLLTLAVALAFAGLRILVGYLWPGRVFDRPDSTEILGLHIEEESQAPENP